MNETLSKFLAIGILFGLVTGVVVYALTNQVLFIEAGLAVGLIIGYGVGTVLSKKNK